MVFLNEGDGFIKEAMPKDPLKIELGFDLTWSSKTGSSAAVRRSKPRCRFISTCSAS